MPQTCRFWKQGCCKYGDHCTYEHGHTSFYTPSPPELQQRGVCVVATGNNSCQAVPASKNNKHKSGVQPGALVHNAALKGHLSCLKAFHKQGLLMDGRDGAQQTPLFKAIHNNHVECVQWLQQQGADLEARDKNDYTLQHTACNSDQLQLLKWLTKMGADLDVRDKGDWTLLHVSAWRGSLECIAWLLQHGADRAAMDEEGRSALDMAKKRGHRACVSFLKQHAKTDKLLETDAQTAASLVACAVSKLLQQLTPGSSRRALAPLHDFVVSYIQDAPLILQQHTQTIQDSPPPSTPSHEWEESLLISKRTMQRASMNGGCTSFNGLVLQLETASRKEELPARLKQPLGTLVATLQQHMKHIRAMDLPDVECVVREKLLTPLQDMAAARQRTHQCEQEVQDRMAAMELLTRELDEDHDEVHKYDQLFSRLFQEGLALMKGVKELVNAEEGSTAEGHGEGEAGSQWSAIKHTLADKRRDLQQEMSRVDGDVVQVGRAETASKQRLTAKQAQLSGPCQELSWLHGWHAKMQSWLETLQKREVQRQELEQCQALVDQVREKAQDRRTQLHDYRAQVQKSVLLFASLQDTVAVSLHRLHEAQHLDEQKCSARRQHLEQEAIKTFLQHKEMVHQRYQGLHSTLDETQRSIEEQKLAIRVYKRTANRTKVAELTKCIAEHQEQLEMLPGLIKETQHMMEALDSVHIQDVTPGQV